MIKKAEKEENNGENETGASIIAGEADFVKKSGKTPGDIKKELEEMFVAGVHFGYSRSSCHPKMRQYIFGIRNNVEIFDLEKTSALLEGAEDFLKDLAVAGKKFLIVATKPAFKNIAETFAKQLGMPYVSERWLGGILTNFKVIKGRVDYFIAMRQKKESGELNKYTKKEISIFNKELLRMERFFNGLEPLTALPAALLIIDPKEEKTAVREAKVLSIPIIAVLNSDCDPTGINYPIPANDASVSSIKYLINRLVKTYQENEKK